MLQLAEFAANTCETFDRGLFESILEDRRVVEFAVLEILTLEG